MNNPTGRSVPPYRPPFHEYPRAGQTFNCRCMGLESAAWVREFEALNVAEIEAWRLFGLHVEQIHDEVLVFDPHMWRGYGAPA